MAEGGPWVGGQCVTDDSVREALSSLGHKIPSLNSMLFLFMAHKTALKNCKNLGHLCFAPFYL